MNHYVGGFGMALMAPKENAQKLETWKISRENITKLPSQNHVFCLFGVKLFELGLAFKSFEIILQQRSYLFPSMDLESGSSILNTSLVTKLGSGSLS